MRRPGRTSGGLISAIGLVGLLGIPAASQALEVVEVVTVVDGSEAVTRIAFTSDGRMVFAERSGDIFMIQDGELRQEPIATIPTSEQAGGVLGLAAPPDARADPGVYALAEAPDGTGSLVFRIALDLQSEPEVVVDDLPAAPGALAFSSEGTLLVAIADRLLGLTEPSVADDGRVPTELTTGLRAARGVAVDPTDDRAVVTDASGALILDGAERRRSLGFVPGAVTFGGAEAEDPYAGGLFVAARADSEIHLVRLDRPQEADEVVVDAGAPVLALAWGPAGLYLSTEERVSVALMVSDVHPDPAVTLDAGAESRGPPAPGNRWFFVIVTLIFVAAYFYGRRRLLR